MIKKWKQLAHGELCELCGDRAAMAPRPVDPSRRRLDGDVHWTNHDHLKAPSLETITRQSVGQWLNVVLHRRDGVGLHQVWFERVTKVIRIAGKVLVAFWKRCARATLGGVRIRDRRRRLCGAQDPAACADSQRGFLHAALNDDWCFEVVLGGRMMRLNGADRQSPHIGSRLPVRKRGLS